MGRLSTHVLDTVAGSPAEGVSWALFRLEGEARSQLSSGKTNSDGRTDGALLEGDAVVAGTYELVFQVADYFTLGYSEETFHNAGIEVSAHNFQ